MSRDDRILSGPWSSHFLIQKINFHVESLVVIIIFRIATFSMQTLGHCEICVGSPDGGCVIDLFRSWLLF